VAGVRVYRALAEAEAGDWAFILGANVLATAHYCKATLPRLRASGDGTIVNVSSVYGVTGRAGMGQYDTTKAAILGFTRALAVEEARPDIRVNAVCPGGTITPYHIRRAATQGISEDALRGSSTQDNLLGRWAEPREVAYPILFLSCRESSFVTGPTLMVGRGPLDPVIGRLVTFDRARRCRSQWAGNSLIDRRSTRRLDPADLLVRSPVVG
jgi:2-hydroxycyclohexanecarboxyl-CoA dehydrogenase